MDAVAICNLALGWVGAGRIAALTEASKLAELCNANFAPVRDAVLEERAWRFATLRRPIAADATAPSWGYAYRYLLPSTVVRVLEVSDGSSSLRDWEREGGYVLTDQVSPIYVRCVERVEDPAGWPPGFTMAVALRLAATLATTLSENRALQDELWARYRDQVKRAGAVEGQQGRAGTLTNDWLARSRG